MSRFFDVKSGLIGGLLALLILTVLGGASWTDRDLQGRFAVMSHPEQDFILDTHTGQIWSIHSHDGRPTLVEETNGGGQRFYDPMVLAECDPNSLI